MTATTKKITDFQIETLCKGFQIIMGSLANYHDRSNLSIRCEDGEIVITSDCINFDFSDGTLTGTRKIA